MIIGFCGYARSGKNEAASYLSRKHGFREDSFAAPIRSIAIQMLGLSGLAELDAIKEEPHALFGGKSPRVFLQKLGTEFAREQFNTDIWVDSLILRNKGSNKLVVSDLRFDNEAEAIKSMKGYIIKIERFGHTIPEAGHKSEAGVSPNLIDFTIENKGSLDDFYAKLDDTYACIKALSSINM